MYDYEIIDNAEANSGLPTGTVLRGSDRSNGDRGCVAVRHDDTWRFISRTGSVTNSVSTLFHSEYEVLYRPDAEPKLRPGAQLTREQVNALSVGSVVALATPGQSNVVQIVGGDQPISWTSIDEDEAVRTTKYSAVLVSDTWTLVRLGETKPEPVYEVGDEIRDPQEFAALPPGSVVLDIDEDSPGQQPAIKTADHGLWAYFDEDGRVDFLTDEDIAECGMHRVLHVPEAAGDLAGAGRTAA